MSSTMIQPYLFFAGRCEEAVQFYQQALGAKVEMLMRFKESPDAPPPDIMPPNWEEKIMHASLNLHGSILMASDGCESGAGFQGFALSFNAPDEAAAHKAFNALADGGKVTMPLAKTFWSPCFGMLTDRFGVQWMVNVDAPPQG